MILITTSRRPTGKIRTFCRDLANAIPDVLRVNRGKMSLDGIAEKAIEVEADRVVLVDRWHGGPGKINFYRLCSSGLESVAPLMLIRGIRLRREINEATRGNRSSVVTLQLENSSELRKVVESLSEFFGLPILSLDEAAQKHCASMHFLFDSNRRLQITFMQLQRMVEIGPRVTLSNLFWEVPS